MSWANSEVSPVGSVAVALTTWPAGTTVGKLTWKLALPFAVGRHRGLAEIGLALAVARGVGRGVGEELHGVAGIGGAVERALDVRLAVVRGGREQDGDSSGSYWAPGSARPDGWA